MIDSASTSPASSSASAASLAQRPGHIVARLVAALGGGWLFTWGFIAFGVMLLSAAGMPFFDARNLTHLLAFLLFLTVFCWAFAATRLLPVYVVLVGGGAAMTGAAWWMARAPI